jgi:hypothetical protein
MARTSTSFFVVLVSVASVCVAQQLQDTSVCFVSSTSPQCFGVVASLPSRLLAGTQSEVRFKQAFRLQPYNPSGNARIWRLPRCEISPPKLIVRATMATTPPTIQYFDAVVNPTCFSCSNLNVGQVPGSNCGEYSATFSLTRALTTIPERAWEVSFYINDILAIQNNPLSYDAKAPTVPLPFTVSVYVDAGAAAPFGFQVSGAGASIAIAGHPGSFTVQEADSFGNLRTSCSTNDNGLAAEVHATASYQRWVLVREPCFSRRMCEQGRLVTMTKNVTFSFSRCSDGKSKATYTFDVAGTYLCYVRVASGAGIGANPIVIQAHPSVVDHSKAIAWGRSFVTSFSDMTADVIVAAHDYLGNPRITGHLMYSLTSVQVRTSLAFQPTSFCPMPCKCSDSFSALLGTGFTGSCTACTISAKNNGDGTYVLRMVFPFAGNHSVQIFNEPCLSQPQTLITGSPFVIPTQKPIWEVTLSGEMSSPLVNQYGVVSLRFKDADGAYVNYCYDEHPELVLKGLDRPESDACRMYYQCVPLNQTVPDAPMEYSECRSGQQFGLFKTLSAGSYAVSAVFPGSATGRSVNIQNSPLKVDVRVAAIDVPSFTATLGDLNGRSCNSVIKFVIHSRDSFSNLVNLNRCGDVVDVVAMASSDGSLLSILSAALAVPTKQLMTMMTSSALWNATLSVRARTDRCFSSGQIGAVFSTLHAGPYRLRIKVNNIDTKVSNTLIYIKPEIITVSFGQRVVASAPAGGIVFFKLVVPQPSYGFQVQVNQISGGQPWLFARFGTIQVDVFPFFLNAGEQYQLWASLQCSMCRLHLSPNHGVPGTWYFSVAVQGGSSVFDFVVHPYSHQPLLDTNIRDKSKPKPSITLTTQPGFFHYFTATVTSGLTSGFQIRAERSSGLGVANLLLSKSDWPNHPNDIRAFQSVNVGMLSCSVCSAIMPPDDDLPGDYSVALYSVSRPATFVLTFTTFEQTSSIKWGNEETKLGTIAPGSWVYIPFEFSQESYAGFSVQVIVTDLKANVSTVLMKGRLPVSVGDSYFPGSVCSNCRIHVFSKQNLTGTWYLGVYGSPGWSGSTGFYARGQLYEKCPNQCSGNGDCVKDNVYVCRCYPGYAGPTCADGVPSKIAVWIPLFFDILDKSGSSAVVSRNLGSADGSLLLANGMTTSGAPSYADFNSAFLRLPNPLPKKHCATGSRLRSNNKFTCTGYSFLDELTVMGWFKPQKTAPGNNSGVTLGTSNFERNPNSDSHWSFMLSLMGHPDGGDKVLANFLINQVCLLCCSAVSLCCLCATGSWSWVQGNSNTDFDMRHARASQVFPNEWTPILRFDNWYHLAGVYGPNRTQLFVDGKLAAEYRSPTSYLRDVPNAELHIGHDVRCRLLALGLLQFSIFDLLMLKFPTRARRYQSFSRLFFGGVRDVRLLRYAASPFEISNAAQFSVR